jgi:hypothetical protein
VGRGNPIDCQFIARLPRIHITCNKPCSSNLNLVSSVIYLLSIFSHTSMDSFMWGSVILFTNGSSYWTRLGTNVMAEDAFLPVDLRKEYKTVGSVQKQRTTKWCSYSQASSVSIVTGGLQNRHLIAEGTELYIFAMTSRWLQGRSISLIGGYRGSFPHG